MSDMSFGDVKTAGRMRDLIESIALGVVNRIRPDTRIGNVHHYDPGLGLAWIQFPGEAEDNLVQVRCAVDKTPSNSIVANGLDGCDIVRVDGRPGNYWISDFVRGFPRPIGITAGTLQRYGGIETPEGFLECLGGEVSQAVYPDLYAAIGDSYGVASAGNFKLPLFHKIYDDVDTITTGLFTAASGWAIDSYQLRVRNSMVYMQVIFHATAFISLSNVDHADQVPLNPTATMLLYAPDIQANSFAAGAVRVGALTTSGTIRLQAGVISNVAGGTLSGDIANGDTFNLNFFYPMPDDTTSIHGERMIIKT